MKPGPIIGTKLVALRPVSMGTGPVVWLFECACGNRCMKQVRLVGDGTTKSCGCLRRNMARNKARAMEIQAPPDLLRLRALGFTLRAMGRMLKVSHQTVHKMLRQRKAK